MHIDPETGDLLGTDSYAAYGSPIQVLFDENGESMVLTQSGNSPPGHLHRGTDVIALPATPSYFDYNTTTGRAVDFEYTSSHTSSTSLPFSWIQS